MVTTQGILDTAIITLLIFIFDYRIGLIALCGIAIFALINFAMRKFGENMSQKKVKTDTSLVGGVIEYIQGIAEVKAYNLMGQSREKLNNTIAEASKINTDI